MRNSKSCPINFGNIKLKFKKINNANPVDVGGKVTKKYEGPTKFDYAILDFKNSLTKLIESLVPEEKRIRTNTKNIKVASFTSDGAQNALENLVEIVNFSSRPIISKKAKKRYKKNIITVLEKVNKLREKDKENIVLVPLRGGAYLINLLDIKPSKVIAIDCKRLPLKKKGHFLLGMRKYKHSSKKWKSDFSTKDFHNKHIRIIEACIVSGMTTIAFLSLFTCNDNKPALIEINTIAMSQQGIELVLKMAKKYNLNVKFVTGGIFYRLGDFYNSGIDELLTLRGQLVLGDIKKYLDFKTK